MNTALLDPLPAEVTALYGQTPAAVSFVTQVQNRIYRYREADADHILRLTPAAHREGPQVAAEIEWVRDLAEKGVSVAAPVVAQDGQYWHRVVIDDTGHTVAAFTCAPGTIGSRECWTADVFRQWGQLTGKLHHATRDYSPVATPRPAWDAQLPGFAPETREEETAFARLRELTLQLQSLPRSRDTFGLIHADLHFWNFAVGPEGLTVFDFDNSEYHWLVADIGTAVFEAATCSYRQGPRAEFIQQFLAAFLDGYQKENDLGRSLEYLPWFVQLREISIFLILGRRWRGRVLTPFQQAFFESLRDGVLKDRSFLET